MSGETYAIVFKGEIVEGFDPKTVQAQLSRMLKADAKKTAALFSGKQIVLKKTADKAEAAKYGKILKKAGADVKIKIIKADATAAAPKAAKPAAAPAFQKADAPVFQKAEAPAFQKAEAEPPAAPPPAAAEPATAEATEAAEAPAEVDTSGLSLAPNVGDLFEAPPAAETPELDLSDYTVAENDGSPLVEASDEVIELDLDLSAMSLKDNDGTPLVEPSDEAVPEIDVPDFGLDEPGAVLETIQEEKELLNPNTMGMTLAAAGADMLEEDEKDQGPPPVAPDTSKINLVPNFDV